MLGATASIARFSTTLTASDLPPDVVHAARRHLLDTVGCIIAGLDSPAAQSVAQIIAPPGSSLPDGHGIRSPGERAYLWGTAAHALELDDGFREGSIHPGVAVAPALMAASALGRHSGEALITALVAGYETICALSQRFHPALRDRGFHPTSVVGVLGAAVAVGSLRRQDQPSMERALGLAASEAGGLFAFLGGGGEVKRLHGGIAARGGLNATLLAERGVSAPDAILERPSGFAQAFAGHDPMSGLTIAMPPESAFRILGCYFKPHACCRHLQPALEALISLRRDHNLKIDDVDEIDVETYSIAQRHAQTGWTDMASAQLSFPYVLAQGLAHGRAALTDFAEAARAEGHAETLLSRLTIRASDEMDALYPAQRPARVTVKAGGRTFTAFAPEASGSPEIPAEDVVLREKFLGLVSPVLGEEAARRRMDAIWEIEQVSDVASVLIDR